MHYRGSDAHPDISIQSTAPTFSHHPPTASEEKATVREAGDVN